MPERIQIQSYMKHFLTWILACVVGIYFSINIKAADGEVATIETSAGTIIVEFWPEVAPKSVENFKSLAKKGFYDGTAFHRIISGIMAQGGDPLTKDPSQESSWGTGGPGYTISAEINPRPHQLGVISMAPGPKPGTSGSQFILCLGNAPQLNGKCSAFGKVKSGLDVLKKIGKTPVKASANGERSKPTSRLEVKSIKIQKAN